MRGAISCGNPWSSAAISGHQRSSLAIKGHQWQSAETVTLERSTGRLR